MRRAAAGRDLRWLSVADVSRQATPDAFDEYQEAAAVRAGEGGECDAMGAARTAGGWYVMVWLV